MTFHQDTQAVLDAAQQAFQLGVDAFADFRAGGDRRYAGLVNSVTAIRSVSNILQNARNLDPGFDEWWRIVVAEAYNNPVAIWFVELRNRIEKQGTIGSTSNSMYVNHLEVDDLLRNAPEGVVSTFLGDQLGRNGWVVRLADGTEETIYFSLPASMGFNAFVINDGPGGRPFEKLFPVWLSSSDKLIDKAAARWAHPRTATRYPPTATSKISPWRFSQAAFNSAGTSPFFEG